MNVMRHPGEARPWLQVQRLVRPLKRTTDLTPPDAWAEGGGLQG